jgi:antirestriction protein ArdC
LFFGLAALWLHHPLTVGTRSPTLIRRRLSRNATDTPAAATRLAVEVGAMSVQDTRKGGSWLGARG